VQPVDPARALGVLVDETGLLQQPEVPGHRRPADRQLLREGTDRARRVAEEGEDATPVRVTEGREGILL
jgi:hypothetical protein